MLGSSEHIGVIVTKLKNSTRESGSFYNKCIREWAYIPCRLKLFVPTCPSWYTYGLLADDMLDLGRNTASHIKFNFEWNRKYYMDFRYPATQDGKHAQTQKKRRTTKLQARSWGELEDRLALQVRCRLWRPDKYSTLWQVSETRFNTWKRPMTFGKSFFVFPMMLSKSRLENNFASVRRRITSSTLGNGYALFRVTAFRRL